MREDDIKAVRVSALRILVVLCIAVVSLMLIHRHLTNLVVDILQEEEYLLENRISSLLSTLDGVITPVDMLNRHTEIILSQSDGRHAVVILPKLEIGYNEELGLADFVSEDKRWGLLVDRAEILEQPEADRELMTILNTRDLYLSISENRPDSAWIYYVSFRGFLFSVPALSGVTGEQFSGFYRKPFWTDSLPQANPESNLVVTDPYEDIGGKEQIITFSKAVTADGLFRGVTCIDLPVGKLRDSLGIGHSLGFSGIIDEDRRTVVFMDDTAHGEQFRASTSENGFMKTDHEYVCERVLLNDELTIVHTIASGDVNREAFRRGMPLILSVLTLNILTLLLLRLRKSYVKVSEERDFSRRLLSIVGHDLQSPLSVTKQATEVLTVEANGEVVNLIRKSNQSALTLLKDLTLWGKTRYGEVQIQSGICPVSVIFERILDVVRPLAELKDVNLDCSDEEFVLNVDSDVLSVVLRNLVTNAVKFSRPGLTVRLEADRGSEDIVLFRVIDQGDGMDEDQVRKVMNRKPLASRPGTRGEKGSGIGLSLVTGLCDQAGWPLTLTSEIDKGTVFTISVPQK